MVDEKNRKRPPILPPKRKMKKKGSGPLPQKQIDKKILRFLDEITKSEFYSVLLCLCFTWFEYTTPPCVDLAKWAVGCRDFVFFRAPVHELYRIMLPKSRQSESAGSQKKVPCQTMKLLRIRVKS